MSTTWHCMTSLWWVHADYSSWLSCSSCVWKWCPALAAPGAKVGLTDLYVSTFFILLFLKLEIMFTFLHSLFASPSHNQSKMIKTGLAMTSAGFLSICGYVPSGPMGLYMSTLFKHSLIWSSFTKSISSLLQIFTLAPGAAMSTCNTVFLSLGARPLGRGSSCCLRGKWSFCVADTLSTFAPHKLQIWQGQTMALSAVVNLLYALKQMGHSEVNVFDRDTGKSHSPLTDQLPSACLTPGRWFRVHLRDTKEQAAAIPKDAQPELYCYVSTALYVG